MPNSPVGLRDLPNKRSSSNDDLRDSGVIFIVDIISLFVSFARVCEKIGA